MNEGCIPFYGTKDRKGYGIVNFGQRSFRAHRASFRLHVGLIPRGMMVCHKCDNPACINPAHLFLGTNSDNIRDCVAKGRHPESRKTFCRSGHPYSAENTYVAPEGYRQCRTCKRAARRKDSARRRSEKNG